MGRLSGSVGGEAKMIKKGPWTAAEDEMLREYVRRNGCGNWNEIHRNTSLSRCGKSCRLRWANHLRPNLKKSPFSPAEERIILDLHATLGNKWARMASQLPGRTDNEIKNFWNTRTKRRQRAGLPLYPKNNNNDNDQNNISPLAISLYNNNSSSSTSASLSSSFSSPNIISNNTPQNFIKNPIIHQQNPYSFSHHFNHHPIQTAPMIINPSYYYYNNFYTNTENTPIFANPISATHELPLSQTPAMSDPASASDSNTIRFSGFDNTKSSGLLSDLVNQGRTNSSDDDDIEDKYAIVDRSELESFENDATETDQNGFAENIISSSDQYSSIGVEESEGQLLDEDLMNLLSNFQSSAEWPYSSAPPDIIQNISSSKRFSSTN